MEKFNLCCCAYDNGHLLSWLKESALEPDGRSLESGSSDLGRSSYPLCACLPFCKLGILFLPPCRVNFLCQPDWATGCLDIWSNIILDESVSDWN